MKKQIAFILCIAFTLGITATGCSNSSESSGTSSSESTLSSSSASVEDSTNGDNSEYPASEATQLTVNFGDDGEPFLMNLEDNSTAAAIAGYVGTTSWRLPIYSYDESDVMQYYDIPSRYEIPDNSENVTEAHAGDVFYSDPNRIVLYYHDAEINEEYTKIGTFDATEEFITAVEENPVLEGWGNKIVLISDVE